jgi:cell division inhibitor SepF
MILDRLKDFVGINDREEYDEDYEEMDWNQQYSSSVERKQSLDEVASPRRSQETYSSPVETNVSPVRNNVIGMPGISSSIAEVVVVEPHSFEEMPQVIQTLRERKSVVLNLNIMDPEEAQRAVDFIAGGTYAIDGHQERIGESIFLFTPSCVKVSTFSGTVRDVPETPASPRSSVPVWGSEPSRMAQ